MRKADKRGKGKNKKGGGLLGVTKEAKRTSSSGFSGKTVEKSGKKSKKITVVLKRKKGVPKGTTLYGAFSYNGVPWSSFWVDSKFSAAYQPGTYEFWATSATCQPNCRVTCKNCSFTINSGSKTVTFTLTGCNGCS